MKTTTSCTECGEKIPESLVGDALCTACRYHNAPKALPHDAEFDRRGFRISQRGIPEEEYEQHPLFAHYITQPEEAHAEDKLELFRLALFEILDGHRDRAHTKVAALCVLLKFVSNQEEAAQRARVGPSSISRALTQLLEGVKRSTLAEGS